MGFGAWGLGVLEDWRTGVLEYWSTGVLGDAGCRKSKIDNRKSTIENPRCRLPFRRSPQDSGLKTQDHPHLPCRLLTCTLSLKMDEKIFCDESRTSKPATLSCPSCRQRETYQLRWLVRRKKKRPPQRADARTRARFEKFQSYMLLLDDVVTCQNPRCRRRIEVSGIKTTAFLSD